MPMEFEDEEDEEIAEESPEEQIKEIEFNMTEKRIDEWINELKRLKSEKDLSILPIDDTIQLKINYEDMLDME
jgi:hypothetical protein